MAYFFVGLGFFFSCSSSFAVSFAILLLRRFVRQLYVAMSTIALIESIINLTYVQFFFFHVTSLGCWAFGLDSLGKLHTGWNLFLHLSRESTNLDQALIGSLHILGSNLIGIEMLASHYPTGYHKSYCHCYDDSYTYLPHCGHRAGGVSLDQPHGLASS